MQIITHTNPKLLIADEGKTIRDINDVYTPQITDESGNVTIQTGTYHPVNEIDFSGGTYNMTYDAVVRKFSKVKQSFIRQQLRQMASSSEKIYDTLIR